MSVASIGMGLVRHARTRPSPHAFAYGTFFLMLPMRSLRTQGPGHLARNRWAPVSFNDRDHGDGRADCLAWLDDTLAAHGVDGADGEVWLHTYPRVWGYSFKPVSFWYCHAADGSLRAVLVEVNNTFGERHCYLLDRPVYGVPVVANKVFHVSPFCQVQGEYRFVFMRSERPEGPRTVVRIDYHDQPLMAEPLLRTSVSGTLFPLTPQTQRQALWRHPAMTWGVVARIHWQAVRLWWQRTPFFHKPNRPAQAVTFGHTSTPTSQP